MLEQENVLGVGVLTPGPALNTHLPFTHVTVVSENNGKCVSVQLYIEETGD